MFISLVILVVFVVSREINATPTNSLFNDVGPEEGLNDLDDISKSMFQRFGKADTDLPSGRVEKRTPDYYSEEEFTVPQKRDYAHPFQVQTSSQYRPYGKRDELSNEVEKRVLLAPNTMNYFKRTPEGYGFNHLARMKKANYGFDHLARMKKANYGFDHLARMKKANYGFDHLARMKKASYGFDHLARMKKAYEFDHLARM